MQEECELLTSLFISDTRDAIRQSQNIISSVSNFKSFNIFCDYHQKHAHISTCQKEWSTPCMSIHCFDCSINDSSCMCLECFLKSNHEGHNYIIQPNVVGNCDCGDTSLLKRQGFCPKHQGLDDTNSHPEDYLDEKLRTTLTDYIFKAAFSALKTLSMSDESSSELIIKFISIFLRFGDGFRRLITISLTEKIDLKDLMRNITAYNFHFNESLQKLCGKLVNDFIFKNNFSQIIYDIILDDILPQDFDVLVEKASNHNYSIWNSFWFHSFSTQQIQYNIVHNHWDWVTFSLKLSSLLKISFSFMNNPSYNYRYPHAIAEIVISIPSCSEVQPNEQTQLFFDKLFTEVINCGSDKSSNKNDTILTASFKEDFDENHYLAIFHFNVHFYVLIKCFKNKKELKLDSFINELDDKINISSIYSIGKNENENDNFRFIEKYLIGEYDEDKKVDFSQHQPLFFYRSFHNGSSMFIANPLYESFLNLFKQDNFNRVKIARFLSMEKHQGLRIRLAITTLKSLFAMICYHESIVPKNNFGLILYLRYFVNNPTVVSNGIPLYMPVLQLLIGLQCNSARHAEIKDANEMDLVASEKDEIEKDVNEKDPSTEDLEVGQNDEEFGLKEFFAYEMAREIGIFDDFTATDYNDESIFEQQKQMMFSFLYYSILLVIERDLFNYDEKRFLKEQLIFALKQGPATLDELNKLFDHKNVIGDNKIQMPASILSTIANSDPKNQKYSLKDGIEWKTITAINTLNAQKISLNNEISKHKNTLLKIPEFEPEETYFFHSQKEPATSNLNGESAEVVDDYDIDSSDLTIRLKDFLFTPTVIAIVYHTLRTNTGVDSSEVELNDHLAMNILLLIHKFVKEQEQQEEFNVCSNSLNESTTFQYNEITELISSLKHTVFNYHVDQNGNTFIQNTLNKDSFNTLIRSKISYSNKPPKSIIDILLNKGEIGKKVLSQLEIIVENDETENQDQKMIMKQRAKKIKEELMNHFKSLISNFSINENEAENEQNNNENDNDDDENKNEDHSDKDACCSICSINRPNEVLSYPIYIYYTKFPYIFDKPVFMLNENINENEIIDDSDLDQKAEEKEIEDAKISAQFEKLNSLFSVWKNVPSMTKLQVIRFLQKEATCRICRNGKVNSEEKNEDGKENIKRKDNKYFFETSDNENTANTNNNNDEENNNNNNNDDEENNNNNNNDDEENNNNNNNDDEENNNNNNNNDEDNNNNNNNNNDEENNNNNVTEENSNNNNNGGGENNRSNNNDDDDDDIYNDDESDAENYRNAANTTEIATNTTEGNRDDENDNDDDIEGNNLLNESESENDIDIKYTKSNENLEKIKKYPGGNFILQFGICQHFVHPDCVHRKSFKCPIDRSLKNGYLPCLEEFSRKYFLNEHPEEVNASTLPFEVVQSIALFVANIYGIFSSYQKMKCDVFVELVKSLSGLITTYEIRLRNLPDCLDSKKTKFLARNLFLSIWYGYRIFGKPRLLDLNQQRKIQNPFYYPISIDHKFTTFQRFIKKLIECDDIESNKIEAFKKIVFDFVSSPDFNPELMPSPQSVNIKRKKKELCLLLRRICLVEYFLLGNEISTEFVDWDEILSINNLFERYNIDFFQAEENEFEFKPFIFTKLPKEFIRFKLKPYCFPVDLTQDLCYFNLVNYKYLLESFDDFDDVGDNPKIDLTEDEEISHMQNQITIFGEQSFNKEIYMLLTTFCVKKSPTIFLYIGRDASKVVVIYQGYRAVLKSFYVDKNGVPDIGYHRNKPLFLKEERLERFTDEILSGDFTNYLEPLIRVL